MLLLIDNYDSFTYNLYQYLCELGAEVEVFRNDKIDARGHRPDGAGAHRHLARARARRKRPASASTTIKRFAGKVPILGVCLGHQCIGEAFGGVVDGRGRDQARQDVAGDARRQGRLRGPAAALRGGALPLAGHRAGDRCRTCWRSRRASESGIIMGVRHKELRIEGVQFHPESILTQAGQAAAGELPQDDIVTYVCHTMSLEVDDNEEADWCIWMTTFTKT